MSVKVLNTRPIELLTETSNLLREFGFESIEFSGLTIEEIVVEDFGTDLAALCQADDAWVFTSPRGLEAIRRRLSDEQWEFVLPRVHFFPIGLKTKEKAIELGAKNLLFLPARDSEEFSKKLIPHCRGRRVFLFQGESAYPQLAESLKALAREFFQFSAYRVAFREPARESLEQLSKLLQAREIHALIFGSSDTVKRTLELVGQKFAEMKSEFLKIPVGAIGQRTAETARSLGFDVRWMPTLPNFQGLLELMKADLLHK